MSGIYNPEYGFFPFVHTVAYRLDISPAALQGDEEMGAMRQVYDRNGSAGEAEAAVRPILERKGVLV
jgi:hypothetical protein